MKERFLTEPKELYRVSFEKYVLAYKAINDDHYFNKYKKALEDFPGYLESTADYSRGKNLADGDVATSTYWLIAEDEVVGVVRIRHLESGSAGHIGYDISPEHRNKGYGSEILKLALEKAVEIGLKEVVLTCNTENKASRKIIEKNNGKFISTIFDKEDNEYMDKFIIVL